MHFFDHNATTPLFPAAREAWLEASDRHWLNPSSPYRAGAAAHARLEDARGRLAAILGVEPSRIVFNSGATEGNNAALEHWAGSLPKDAEIGLSPTEHPSVLEAAKRFFGERILWLPLDENGAVNLSAVPLERLAALTVMAANNETGVLNPWSKLALKCEEAGVLFHCDASQWIGKMPTDGLSRAGFVTGCAHKFGGPKGVGFLIVPGVGAKGLVGGEQESGRRAGTEDLPSIWAMVAALEVCEAERLKCSSEPRDEFVRRLREVLPGCEFSVPVQSALWNTVSVIMPEFKSSRWIRALEKRGFLVSAGSACSSGKDGPSHVIAAMGMDVERSDRVLRISSGWRTSIDNWMGLLAALIESHAELRSEASNSGSQVISI